MGHRTLEWYNMAKYDALGKKHWHPEFREMDYYIPAYQPSKFRPEGQKKKILLAIFAASKANIYILDEPFANLDRNGFSYLSKIIEEKNNNNDVIIYTSHEDKISFTKELNIDDYK